MAYVHDPKSGQKGHIDTRVAISRRGNINRFENEQDRVVVVQEQAAFCGNVGYVRGFRPRMRGNEVEKGQK